MNDFYTSIKMAQYRSIIFLTLLFLLLFSNGRVIGQITFSEPLENPFGMLPINLGGGMGVSYAGDFDADGDYDFIYKDSNFFLYYENIGSAIEPNFSEPLENPFNLSSGAIIPNHHQSIVAADLDNDADLDIIVSDMEFTNAGNIPGNAQHTGNVQYFENIGTPESPNFSAAVKNPFNLKSAEHCVLGRLVDLDNDGDLDFFSTENVSNANPTQHTFAYQENIGTASNPNFADKSFNPFGLENIIDDLYSSNPTLQVEFGDIDKDGDYDIILGRNTKDLFFIENIGSPNLAQFVEEEINPFGITDSSVNIPHPNLVDLDGDSDLDLVISHGLASTDFSFIYFENLSPVTEINPILIQNSISFYPNPIHHQLHIENRAIIAALSLYDLNGKNYDQQLDLSKSIIDVSSLKKGIYLLKVVLKNQEVSTVKLFKT